MSEKIAILPEKDRVMGLVIFGGLYDLLEFDWKETKCDECGEVVLYYQEKPKDVKKVCMKCAENLYPKEFYETIKRGYIKGIREHLERTKYIQ